MVYTQAKHILLSAFIICMLSGIILLCMSVTMYKSSLSLVFAVATALFFILLNTGSFAFHQFVAQKMEKQLPVFYITDKVLRLILSALFFVCTIATIQKPTFNAAVVFCLYYLTAMAIVISHYIQFEKQEKQTTL